MCIANSIFKLINHVSSKLIKIIKSHRINKELNLKKRVKEIQVVRKKRVNNQFKKGKRI